MVEVTPRGKSRIRDSEDAPLLASPAIKATAANDVSRSDVPATSSSARPDVPPPSHADFPDASAPGSHRNRNRWMQKPSDDDEDPMLKSPAQPPSWAQRCAFGDTPPLSKLLQPPPEVQAWQGSDACNEYAEFPLCPPLPAPSPDRYRTVSRANSLPPAVGSMNSVDFSNFSRGPTPDLSYVEQEQEIARFLGDILLGTAEHPSPSHEQAQARSPSNGSGVPKAQHSPVLESCLWRLSSDSHVQAPGSNEGGSRKRLAANPLSPPQMFGTPPQNDSLYATFRNASPDVQRALFQRSMQRSLSADRAPVLASFDQRPAQATRTWEAALEEDQDESDGERQLSCRYCSRTFWQRRLGVHEEVCAARKACAKAVPRPSFDSRQQRRAKVMDCHWWIDPCGNQSRVGAGSSGSTAATSSASDSRGTPGPSRSTRIAPGAQVAQPSRTRQHARSPPATPERVAARKFGSGITPEKLPEKRSESTPCQSGQQRRTPLSTKGSQAGAVKAKAAPSGSRTATCSESSAATRSPVQMAPASRTANTCQRSKSVGAVAKVTPKTTQTSMRGTACNRPRSASHAGRGRPVVPPLPLGQAVTVPAQPRADDTRLVPAVARPAPLVTPGSALHPTATNPSNPGTESSDIVSEVAAPAQLIQDIPKIMPVEMSHAHGEAASDRASSSQSQTCMSRQEQPGLGDTLRTLSPARSSDDSVVGRMLREVGQLGAQVDELISRRRQLLGEDLGDPGQSATWPAQQRPYDPARYCEKTEANQSVETSARLNFSLHPAEQADEDVAWQARATLLAAAGLQEGAADSVDFRRAPSIDSAERRSLQFQAHIRGCAQQIRERRWKQHALDAEDRAGV